MSKTLADIIPFAIAVALSPLPVGALLLILVSGEETARGRAFAVGWTGAVATLALVPIIAHLSINSSHPPTALRAAGLTLGLLFLAAAILSWARRSNSSEDEHRPALLARIDGISQPGAATLAVGLAVLNAKDATVSLAAGVTIASAGASVADATLALVVFVALATLTVTTPLALRALARERAEPALQRAHGWLERNGQQVGVGVLALSGLFLVFAAIA
jgi:hypothetical protein